MSFAPFGCIGRFRRNVDPRLRVVAMMLCAMGASGSTRGQDAKPPEAEAAPPSSMNDVVRELRQLRQEVQEARQLKQEFIELQNEVKALRGARTATGPPGSAPTTPAPSLPPGPGGAPAGSDVDVSDLVGTTGPQFGGEVSTYRSGAPAPQPSKRSDDNFPMRVTYQYINNGTGPWGGGGSTRIATADDEFVINFTNHLTLDGTFFNHDNMPTTEKGFNSPFTRNFIYGNITKNWIYQFGTQGFLGTFNLLDFFVGYRFGDAMTVRVGKGLAPPLYEYTAFTPALEPVITNSPLFQMAAGRPIGVMFFGNILGNRVQYWSGVNNTAKSTYYALDRNVEYDGAFDVTPFKGENFKDSILSSLGGGVGLSAGAQNYALNQGNAIGFTNNGEATTNGSWITSSGIPFAVYNNNVRAVGTRSRFAPHIYWYGRFSVLAEYMNYSRELTDGTTRGRSTQHAYYVNLSYYLTGERDFNGNGFQGYTPMEPLAPWVPSQGKFGPGAWQIAAQWSELNVGNGDFNRGFIDPTRYTNRLGQLMAGVNWWPNKYTRLSFDYVWTNFNRAIPIAGPTPMRDFDTFWMRFAMFF